MNIERVYFWVGLTVQQPFNTGVQRVARCLAVALQNQGIEIIPVKWDPGLRAMVPISQSEADHFAKWGGPRIAPAIKLPETLADEWLIIPEITPMLNAVGVGKSLGMHVAKIFYDMIPLKTPEFYEASTFRWLEDYWSTFAAADVVLPISNTVKFDLINWLLERRRRVPFTQPSLLSGELPNIPRVTTRKRARPPERPFRLLATGSWEPRKNYPRMIRAVEAARKSTGQDIRLTIVGRSMDVEYPALQSEIRGLVSRLGGQALELHDYMSDPDMNHLFETTQATIFGSWVEGFGLPVLESLWRGLPCICHNGSALAEIAPGGGTLMVDMENEEAIADAIARLASNEALFERLSGESLVRPLRTWSDYGKDVLDALQRAEIISPLVDYDPLHSQ
jgi:glycosyltransferase involved in cell wall biosynthesis